MDDFIISQNDFRVIVERLIKRMNVYGPIPRFENVAFGPVSSFDNMVFDYHHTALPPKKLLFPPKETLFNFKPGQTEGIEPEIDAAPQCIVGVRPCDIRAISLMDKVFSAGVPDPYYLSRRENTLIIGLDCMPDDECFCASLHTDIVTSGYDLFFTPLSGMYMVNAATKQGKDILRQHGELRPADDATHNQVQKYRELKKSRVQKQINADYRSLPLYYAGAFMMDDIWKKYADRCFSCGSCVLVCPTCYCFNVEDEVDITLQSGRRVREWDGCMLPDFAVVATGENFRKSREARLRHRLNRKFQFHTARYGALFCVGCGRCGRACLAEIKPTYVTNDIIEKEKEI